MEEHRSTRLKAIFLRAAEVEGAEREAVLAAECAGDAALRARLDELLAHHEDADTMDILPRPAEEAPGQTLMPGRLVSGRFRVVRLVGRGGMGEVYEAADQELGGRLALKLILPGLVQNEEMLARFRREVNVARQVTHPNLCRIFDVGRDQADGVDLLYLTMEFIDGETLAAYLKRRGRLEVDEAQRVLAQIAAGLAALHEKRMVHRDLKPSNVMLPRTENGEVRAVIGDFGLARAVYEESLAGGLSQTGMVLGTPGYMSPEQMAGQRVTTASDIYSLGVLAFEMVTGIRASSESAARGHGLPPHWERVIRRCLDENPRARPASALEVAGALAAPKGLSRRWWLAGGVAAALAGAAPMIWRWVPRPDAGYEAALELLKHEYRPGAVLSAIQMLEPMAQAAGAKGEIHAALGNGYYCRYQETQNTAWLKKAARAAERAALADESSAAARVLRGRIHMAEGADAEAASDLQSALQLDARSAEVFVALAELAEKRGRGAEIEPSLRKAVELEAADQWKSRAAYGRHLFGERRWDEARKAFEGVVAAAPDNAEGYAHLGWIALGQERYAEARGAFEKELALAPGYRVYLDLGEVLALQGGYGEAAKWFQRATEDRPGEHTGWGHLGAAFHWSGEAEKSKEAYRRAIALAEAARRANPRDPVLLGWLGGYYASVGNGGAGVGLLRQAVEIDPENAATTYKLGVVNELAGRREEALRWIGAAIRLGCSVEKIRRNPDLAALRKDSRFSGLGR